ncbi:hypothetical protein [Sphingobacterium endophyticum]|uniref:hypothetical protein n=1 Tax=Sphingobacterium endophyticum TaxID=2546448 RepID=UPI0012E13B86|nr:hypothetical protein [Sphingobacterium endophyticum]
MNNIVPIIDSKKTFTPLFFYSDFLDKLVKFYRENRNEEIVFRLFEKGDDEIFNSSYRIDPISIPLLLSIIEQLSKYHRAPLKLLLNNNHATLDALEFLYRANFFKTISEVKKETKILQYDPNYLGAFKGCTIRKEHIVRSYRKEDFPNIDFDQEDEIYLRDQVNSVTSYHVQNHFQELLFDNEKTSRNHNTYIDILSELITNGVIHSKSTTYAMMFVDKYHTKFSISDNGIGLRNSLSLKTSFPFYYEKNEIKSTINLNLGATDKHFVDNLIDIFEILYFSSLKERRGLFDLMINVVIKSNGYFRLHNDNCQIIISNRIFKYMASLNEMRESILMLHNLNELGKLEFEDFKSRLLEKKAIIKNEFIKIIKSTLKYYSGETKFSSIRFYNVKFKGVHVEVEIPN